MTAQEAPGAVRRGELRIYLGAAPGVGSGETRLLVCRETQEDLLARDIGG